MLAARSKHPVAATHSALSENGVARCQTLATLTHREELAALTCRVF